MNKIMKKNNYLSTCLNSTLTVLRNETKNNFLYGDMKLKQAWKIKIINEFRMKRMKKEMKKSWAGIPNYLHLFNNSLLLKVDRLIPGCVRVE